MILSDIIRKKIQDEVAKLDLSQDVDRHAKLLWLEAEDELVIANSFGSFVALEAAFTYFLAVNEIVYSLDVLSSIESQAWGKIRVSAMQIRNFIKKQEENYRDPV